MLTHIFEENNDKSKKIIAGIKKIDKKCRVYFTYAHWCIRNIGLYVNVLSIHTTINKKRYVGQWILRLDCPIKRILTTVKESQKRTKKKA